MTKQLGYKNNYSTQITYNLADAAELRHTCSQIEKEKDPINQPSFND